MTRVRDYHVATDLDDALRRLQEPESAPFLPSPRWPDAPPAPVLVDLGRLELAYIRREGSTLRIGAQTPLEALATDATLQTHADGLLAQVARLACHRGLRNLATLAGALADSDGPPEIMLALIALGASALVRTPEGEHVAEVFAALPPGALLVEVSLPLQEGMRASLERVARTPLDQAIVAAVTVAQDGRFTVAVSPEAGTFAALQINPAGRPLKPHELDAYAAAVAEDACRTLAPQGDARGSADYRSEMARVLARRTLRALITEGPRA